MKVCVHQQWKPSCGGEVLLVADVRRAQTTYAMLTLLKQTCNNEVALVPPGAMSIVQSIVSMLPSKLLWIIGYKAPA